MSSLEHFSIFKGHLATSEYEANVVVSCLVAMMLNMVPIIMWNPSSKTRSVTYKPKGFKIQDVNVSVGSLHYGGAQSRPS